MILFCCCFLAQADDKGDLESLADNFSRNESPIVSFFEPRYLDTAVDANAPSKNLPLIFKRIYIHNSLYPPELGVFGYGWTHDFDIYLEHLPDGNVAFYGHAAKRIFQNSSGIYKTSNIDQGVLVRDGSGLFQLRERNGIIYRFYSNLSLNYIEDRNGNRISAKYNQENQLSRLIHSDGFKLSLYYNQFGRISKIVDNLGRRVNYEYISDGLYLSKIITSDGNVASYDYITIKMHPDIQRLKSINKSDETDSFIFYDSKGRVSRIEHNEGTGQLTYSYMANNTTRITNADGGTWTIALNDLGVPVEVKNPSGQSTRFDYDSRLNLILATSPSGKDSHYTYDDNGNLIRFTDSLGNQFGFRYEPVYNKIVEFVDPLGRIIIFSYDDKGNLIQIKYPTRLREKFTYDNKGNLLAKTTRSGQKLIYEYDNTGHIVSKIYPDNSKVTYSYDNRSRLINASDGLESIKFDYDNLDRVVRTIYPSSRIFKYSYDRAGRLSELTDPDGEILFYAYDDADRLIKISDGQNIPIVEFQYGKSNKRIKKILGNRAYTTYKYDVIGKISELINYDSAGKIISSFNYMYDADGNIISKKTLEGYENYSYDSLGQLMNVTYADGSSSKYEYDSMNNRISSTENGSFVVYSTNELNQYLQVGLHKYKYDLNGNLILNDSGESKAYYDYDFENKLMSVQDHSNIINYTYDPLGLLRSRSNGSNIVYYLWNGYQIAIEEDAEHRTLAKYVYGNMADEPVKMNRNGAIYYYTQDALSSTINLLDAQGMPKEYYRYSAFGKPLSKGQIANPYLYTGATYDFDTGLQYNRYRYYSPDLGRFITNDPIYMIGGPNTYSYSLNNPIGKKDILGLYGYDDITGLAFLTDTSIALGLHPELAWRLAFHSVILIIELHHAMHGFYSPTIVVTVSELYECLNELQEILEEEIWSEGDELRRFTENIMNYVEANKLSLRNLGYYYRAFGYGGTYSYGGYTSGNVGSTGYYESSTCPPGQIYCNGACVNTQINAANCGACGNSCPGGRTCCSGRCIDTQIDPSHCGACNNPCPGGRICENGECSICPAGQTDCGTCVDIQTDPAHCGTCGNYCPGGRTCCSGQCTDTQTDPAHCGACDLTCNPREICVVGVCTCSSGTECNGDCVDTQTDSGHCGDCELACDPGWTCVDGACSCPADKTDCSGDCVDTQTDSGHCGDCDLICDPGWTCVDGACSCLAGKTDCSGDCVDTQISSNHCSDCGILCDPGESCVDGICKTTCPADYIDCDGTCEDAMRDRYNCGKCGKDCDLVLFHPGEYQYCFYSIFCFDGECVLLEIDDNSQIGKCIFYHEGYRDVVPIIDRDWGLNSTYAVMCPWRGQDWWSNFYFCSTDP
jgi:RHS repeat-associated protein